MMSLNSKVRAEYINKRLVFELKFIGYCAAMFSILIGAGFVFAQIITH